MAFSAHPLFIGCGVRMNSSYLMGRTKYIYTLACWTAVDDHQMSALSSLNNLEGAGTKGLIPALSTTPMLKALQNFTLLFFFFLIHKGTTFRSGEGAITL